MPVKPWTIQSARLRCPHCGKTVQMRFKGRWGIRKAFGKDSPTPESTLSKSLSPESTEELLEHLARERDEGEEPGDGA